MSQSPTSAGVDRGRAEGFPDDRLTDVGRDKEGDTRAKTIALLQQLIQQQNNQTCNKQLQQRETGNGFVLRKLWKLMCVCDFHFNKSVYHKK